MAQIRQIDLNNARSVIRTLVAFSETSEVRLCDVLERLKPFQAGGESEDFLKKED